MADAETEAEWAKLRRIAKEKEKAAKALDNAKPDKANLAYLDPKSTKVKGFSRDRDVVLRAVEKFASASIVFVISGIVLNVVGRAGGIVSGVNQLGLGAAIISGLPSTLGMACLIISVVAAVTGIVSSIWAKIKYGTKTKYTLISSVITLVIFGVFEIIWYNI